IEGTQSTEGSVASFSRRRSQEPPQLDVANCFVERGQRSKAKGTQGDLLFYILAELAGAAGTANVGQRFGRAETHQRMLTLERALESRNAILSKRLQAQRCDNGFRRIAQLLFELAPVWYPLRLRFPKWDGTNHPEIAR